MIIIDFETRSAVDLKLKGSAAYVADPSTDAICMALFNTETQHKQIWYSPDPLPDMMRYMLENADLVAAHNAEFDMGIYEFICVEEYGFPEIPFRKWYCTSAQCRVNALPAGLDDAAFALGLKQRKDHRGAQLIKQLSIPQADGLFNRDPMLIAEFGEYCMQDVIVTAGIVEATRPMTKQEHEDWLVNTRINERGVKVDLELATLALQYADAEQKEIAVELLRITKGLVERHTQNARIKKWLLEDKVLSPLANEMLVYKKGKATHSLDKNIRRNILLKYDSGELFITEDQATVIQLLDDGNKSSVAKFKRMGAMADPDDHRIRGAFVFAGASQTMRYASRGLQLHNMRRDCWDAEETKDIKTLMRQHALLTLTNKESESVMDTLAKLMRPAIIPEKGSVFVVGDWASIESRCLHFVTDTQAGDDRLDFIESGADTYQDVSDALKLGDRQMGKVAELSLGYQGAVRALQAMSRNYGMSIPDHKAQDIVWGWRNLNPHVVNFWQELETAAKSALAAPNTKFKAGVIEYIFIPDFIDGTLICNLGGGNFIQYPRAKISKVMTPYGKEVYSVTALKAGFRPKADAKEWPRVALYGGLFCENVCQAFAAALLRNSLNQLDDVILHAHDEIVLEVLEVYADQAIENLKEVMLTVPEWAKGLPLKMEPTIMLRYGK